MHNSEALVAVHRAQHDQVIDVYGVEVKLRRKVVPDPTSRDPDARNVYGEEKVPSYLATEAIKAIIRFPDQAAALGHKSLFIEEFLPVESEFKYADDVKIGDQIEVEYLHPNGKRQRIIMDLVDTRVASAQSEAAGITFLLAPVRE